MKKIVSVMLLGLLVFAVAGCDNADSVRVADTSQVTESAEPQDDNFDFRKLKWGATREDVKKAEEATFIDEAADMLIYRDVKVAGLNASLGYVFENGKLVQGSYSFAEKHSNNNLYINDYDKVKKALTEKYGEGEEVWSWNDDLFKGDEDNYGLAISAGHLKIITMWVTEKTRIMLSLHGDNYEIGLTLWYTDINYKPSTNTEGL